MTRSIRDYWTAASGSFDDEPDHGLRDPVVRATWATLLQQWLPAAPARVLDIGCGTGSLTLVMAELGHRVTGLDLSAAMVDAARRKLDSAGLTSSLVVGDASHLPARIGAFDVVVCRHLLWTLPDPAGALRRWVGLLGPSGRLLAIEGRWSDADGTAPYAEGAESMPWMGGVGAEVLRSVLERMGLRVRVVPLKDAGFWGHAVIDERYLLVADARPVPADISSPVFEKVRQLALSFPDTSERLAHGSPSFYVRDKLNFLVFSANHHQDGNISFWCAAPPGDQAALVEGNPKVYFVPPYVGHRGWVGVRVDQGAPWAELAEAITDAYRVRAPRSVRLAAGLDI